jgi:predicted dehydrogenase
MVLDWGVHLIDQMLRIVYDKKIESIYCRLDHITNDEVDDGFKLDIYFEKGLTARIEVGTSHFIELPRFYMAGTNGAALINGWKDNCKLVLCETWEEKNIVPVVTSAGLTKTMAPRKEDSVTECFIERPKSDVHDFYRNFCAAVHGEAEMIVTHDQLMRVMRVMEACFLSDETHLPVKFDDVIC